MQFSLLESDLSYIYSNIQSLLLELYDANIFITGANGFFGIWLIEALLYANYKSSTNISIYALSRSKENFYRKYPHLESFSALKLIEGTVLDYRVGVEKIDYIIHAANLPFDNSADWATRHIDCAINGTKKVIETAGKYNVNALLFTSSGAIYNDFHANNKENFREEDFATQTAFSQVYSMGKIVSEQLLKDFYDNRRISTVIARCFAFAGAHLPLDKFAFGNFIKNAILKEDIVIKGSGETVRSYLYGTDLVIYLLTMLVRAKNYQVYNVGSDEAVSLQDLAKRIAEKYELNVKVLGEKENSSAPLVYAPSMEKFKNDFTFQNAIALDESIDKTYAWNKQHYTKREG